MVGYSYRLGGVADFGIATGWTSCRSWYSYRFGRVVELDTPGGWDYSPARYPEWSDSLNSVGSGRVPGSRRTRGDRSSQEVRLRADVASTVALACCVLSGSLSESPPWLSEQCADGGAGPLLKLAARQNIRVQPERPSSGHAPWAIGRLAE